MLNRKISLEDLCSYPQLAVNLSGAPDALSPFDIALQERGMSRPVKLVVNQFLVATTMLRESELLAVLPLRLVVDAFRRNWISYQPLPFKMPEATLYLVWHKRNNGLPGMTWLKDIILRATAAMNEDVARELGEAKVA